MIYEALSVNSSITIVFVAPNIDAEDQYEDLKSISNRKCNTD